MPKLLHIGMMVSHCDGKAAGSGYLTSQFSGLVIDTESYHTHP